MNYELLKLRAVAFGYEAASLFLSVFVAVLASPDFAALVTTHFGDTVLGGVLLLVLTGLVKHLRNLDVIKKAEVGGDNNESQPFYLI